MGSWPALILGKINLKITKKDKPMPKRELTPRH